MSQVTQEINKVTGTVIGTAARFVLYGVLLLLLIEGMGRGYAFGYEIFCSAPAEAAPGRDLSFTVAEGQSEGEVIGRLQEAGLIRDSRIAAIQQRFYDYEIYPGSYTLNTSMTSKEILQALNVRPEGGNAVPEETESAAETESLTETETAAEPEGQAENGAERVEIRIDSLNPSGTGQDGGVHA